MLALLVSNPFVPLRRLLMLDGRKMRLHSTFALWLQNDGLRISKGNSYLVSWAQCAFYFLADDCDMFGRGVVERSDWVM